MRLSRVSDRRSIGRYALFKLGRRALPFAAGAGGVALILFIHNKIAFGNPFFLSYEAYKLSFNSQFPEQAVGFVGLTYPRLHLLWKILITRSADSCFAIRS